MKKCQNCGTANRDSSQFCEECGTRFAAKEQTVDTGSVAKHVSSPGFRAGSVTSVGIPPLVESNGVWPEPQKVEEQPSLNGVHAKLVIERGDSANTEFALTNEESNIGRWDADNGIFPDVDLDAHDADAKVSRRHARIVFRKGVYMIEDLGSTNGTFINRGRRLLPGSPQVLSEGDEIIVGKTFLRFRIGSN